MKNLQNDIIAIVDENGNRKSSYHYGAWGDVSYESNYQLPFDDSVISPFGYRSYMLEYELGAYYLQSRYYFAELSRFLNSDLPEYAQQQKNLTAGINLFAYCCNDPINNVDTNGNLVVTSTMLICAAIGAVVVGVAGGFAGYYISKKLKIPKGSRWKYVTAGAIIGAVAGAAAGFGLGYCVGGGSVVAVVGKSGTAVSTKALNLGNKLKYVFGKATGSTHNIERSRSMYSILKKVGIWDNKFGNEYLTKCIIEMYKNATPYISRGKVIREAMIYGPGGGAMMQTVWEGTKLITIYIFG